MNALDWIAKDLPRVEYCDEPCGAAFMSCVSGGRCQRKLAGYDVAVTVVKKPEPARAVDPRDHDPNKRPPFDYHNCYRCDDSNRPCIKGAGNEWKCETLHARND